VLLHLCCLSVPVVENTVQMLAGQREGLGLLPAWCKSDFSAHQNWCILVVVLQSVSW